MSGFNELLDVFREEAQALLDKLASLTKKMLSLRGEDLDKNLQLLSMATHNLKGAATTADFNDIVNISHAIEDILDKWKEDSNQITAEKVDSVLEAITVMHLSLAGENIQHRLEAIFQQLGGRILKESYNRKNQQGEAERSQSEANKEKSTGEKIENIRVDTSRLDRLMGFAGVLLESEARMEAHNARWKGFVKELQKYVKQDGKRAEVLEPFLLEARYLLQKDRNDLLDFSHLVQEISDAMKQMRMVPLKNAESLWHKIVREAAYLSQKRVELQVSVGEIEIDKQVLEQLRDPLMHLLRNAVDHGIETDEIRVKQGKPPQGQVQIRAQVQGARLQFEISDDGKGINLEEVYESAVAKGLLNSGDKNNQEKILDVLFDPGFSTTQNLTSLSGRGVGLTVVRSQVENLGGHVAIDPCPSTGGTTFLLAVPLSILSSLGLMVRMGETVYALPLEYVFQTLRVSTDDIEYVDGKPLVHRGHAHPLRLAWLAEIVGIKPSNNTKMLPVVVLQRSDVQMALIVDEVIGKSEFVTQALPWNFIDIPGVNGAVIQADGSVAISLDVPFLFNSARTSGKEPEPLQTTEPQGLIKNILVVDDSMASITLGRTFLEAAGYTVSTAIDGMQAWKMLQEQDFDLVVSDVNMPNMNGLELTSRIRQNSKYKDLPVILVTSKAQPEDIDAGASAGADEYVIKGTFDQQNLVELVSKYL